MASDRVAVEAFDPRRLGDDRLRDLARLHNTVLRETRPDDPARPLGYYRDLYHSLAGATEYDRRFWWARDVRDRLAGALTGSVRTTGDNGHVMHVELLVAPEARGRGLGRALLRRAALAARQQGQTLLIGLITGSEPLRQEPAGRFSWALGGRPGLEHRIYRLELGDVDATLLRRWQDEGLERCPEARLVWRLEPFRRDELVAVSYLMQAMNGAPRGRLKTEPRVYTPHSVAERDRSTFERGFRRSVVLAWHRDSGALMGYTMMLVDPYDRRVLRQADTAVEPSFRGRGLGKWLKAAMLERMLHDHPESSEVRTGNADANDAILRINRQLGFRPWLAHSVWQVPLDTLLAALGEPGAGPRPSSDELPSG